MPGRASGRSSARGRAKGRGSLSAAKAAFAKKPIDYARDIGCTAGAPENVLPWASGEALPEVPFTWNGTLPPYQRTPPKRCAIFVDRHVHKNGGSTMRDLLLENERLGHGLYQGYTQMYWGRLFRTIRQLHSGAEAPRQLLMYEAHFGWVEYRDRVLPDLLQLRKLRPDCPVHTLVRIREPLEYYLSFYRWGVAFRQKQSPAAFGATFVEWVEKMPDLQSTVLMRGMAAMAAEYHVSQFKRSYHTPLWGRLDDDGRQKLLASFLDTFSTVAPMAHFDASILMASDATGLPLLLYKRNKPGQKGGFRGTSATVCPDMLACRAAVAKAAPLDTWMYEKYAKAFEGKLAELGDDFAGRVEAYKQAVAAAQPAWKRVPRKQFLCRYHPEDDVIARMPYSELRCPIRDAPELCRLSYSYRNFECPWQYQPNSSLTDPLGCWRPSSGFKR